MKEEKKRSIKKRVAKKPVKKMAKKETVKKVEPKGIEKVPKKDLLKRNYLTVAVIILCFILITIGTYSSYLKSDNVKQNIIKNNYADSYLEKKSIGNVITCDDISNATTGSESFIYVTTLGTQEEMNLEIKLAQLIKEYHLESKFFIYIDGQDNCGSITSKDSTKGQDLKLTSNLTSIPAILYYRDGSLSYIVEREDKSMLNDGDFMKLLDIYQISK